MKRSVIYFSLLLLILVLSSCNYSNYEAGNGDYSYLSAEFVIAETNGNGEITRIVTDNNEYHDLVDPVRIQGNLADTIYRALVYYDNAESGVPVRLRSYTPVPVAKLKSLPEGKQPITDPLGFDSMWLSYNGSYINLGLKLMVGVDEKSDEELQSVGFLLDKKEDNHYYLTLLHNQNGVPEYYTHKAYVSLSVKDNFVSGDIVTVSINTYDGLLEKTIYVP